MSALEWFLERFRSPWRGKRAASLYADMTWTPMSPAEAEKYVITSDPATPDPIAVAICTHCHRDILDTDATDDTGTLHFEPCAGEAAAMLQDMLTDRARDEAMMREVAK